MALAKVVLPRLAAVLVAVGGLALVVLGLQRTSAFGGEQPLIGRMPRIQQPVVVTALGMTELSGATVRARAASASSAPVFIGVGRADDVDAYLGDVARVELTGLGPSGVLHLANRTGTATLPDPSGVDVWVASVRAGGVATLTWPRTPGRWRLVVATDGATPPSAVELTWSGSAGTSPVPAMLAVGAVLFVVGTAGLLAMRSGRIFAVTEDPADADEGPSEVLRPARSRRDAQRGHRPGPPPSAGDGPTTGRIAAPDGPATAGREPAAAPAGSAGPAGPAGVRDRVDLTERPRATEAAGVTAPVRRRDLRPPTGSLQITSRSSTPRPPVAGPPVAGPPVAPEVHAPSAVVPGRPAPGPAAGEPAPTVPPRVSGERSQRPAFVDDDDDDEPAPPVLPFRRRSPNPGSER